MTLASALKVIKKTRSNVMGLLLIFPTFGGHLQKGILAPNEVIYGTQRLQAIQP
jgi:hypothetical protein